MDIIKDFRILKAIEKKYNLKFDKEFKYCISENISTTKNFYINNKEYKLIFLDGCFYPYLIQTKRIKADFTNIPTFYNFVDVKEGCMYFLSEKLDDNKKDDLYNKFFNIEFYISENQYAPEIKHNVILIKKVA